MRRHTKRPSACAIAYGASSFHGGSGASKIGSKRIGLAWRPTSGRAAEFALLAESIHSD